MDLVLLTKNGLKTPYWNISANVGLASPNRAEDVQFVQFGYYATLMNPASGISPEQREAYSKIVLGQPCNGTPSDPLVAAIRIHQKTRGHTQDGHVSPLKGDGHYDAAHTFIVIPLNNNICDIALDVFPRIDKHPKCPSLVAEFVKRTCKP